MRPYLLIIISYRKPPLPHQTRPHQTNTKKTVQKSAEISKQLQTPPPSIHLILHHLQHAKQAQLGTEADLLRFELEFLMGEADSERNQVDASLHGLFSVSSPRFLWKSRRRRASTKTNPEDVAKLTDVSSLATPEKLERSPVEEQMPMDSTPVASVLSEKRKALFEPLDPATSKRASAETLLPPPDFDSAIYPKGWLVGKKRKLVNVDVVESMRRIAVQEMNRKDREIDGLNEQLEEDSRCLEHLQIQLLEEKRKRSEVERENNMLQEQLNMLMNVLQENEAMDEEDEDIETNEQEP